VKISIKFLWRDMWIGAYLSENALYLCLIPMFPIKVEAAREVE
jgi:hypothetical protein